MRHLALGASLIVMVCACGGSAGTIEPGANKGPVEKPGAGLPPLGDHAWRAPPSTPRWRTGSESSCNGWTSMSSR